MNRSAGLLVALIVSTSAQAAPQSAPLATIDLTTGPGLANVEGTWRYSDVQVVPAMFRAPDVDGQPTGAPNATYDIQPHAGAVEFDDSSWPVVAPESLKMRRGSGRLSFNWYRLKLSIPTKVGKFATQGSTVVFSTSLDDYAEVWTDGELPRVNGASGGAVVAGWNARNRVVIADSAEPGRAVTLAVFGINGPISATPTNFIWMREARLEFYPPRALPYAFIPQEVNVDVERRLPALDAIVPANPKVFKLAQGFKFTEGPLWHPAGHLLFSDPNANRIYKYSEPGTEPGKLEVFREQSGYAGADISEYRQPGSNGLAVDPKGRLTINQHGNRRVIRLEADGQETVLAASFDGKRLNSPNDLVYKSDGSLYFTDPPFGLPQFDRDPRRELDVYGVYRVHDGKTELLNGDLTGPNGIAFSPDEHYLYVGDWDAKRKVVMRYALTPDGHLDAGQVFADMTSAPGEDAIDGIKVDSAGHLFVSGPGGIWIFDADGQHLGTVHTPRHVHNMAWGGRDGRTLYLAAQDRLYRMDLLIAGAGLSREAAP